jgi:hypothetical protein
MKKLRTALTAAVVGLALGQSVLAQPRPPQREPYPVQRDQRVVQDMSRGQGPRSNGQYYYNGRWVDQGEWQRHGAERDRWARSYQRRRGYHGGDNSSGLVAGIIGFALGAAIVGSQQQAERAQTADERYDVTCARKYRSYDRNSRTYLGVDGLRHYCQ